MQKIVQIVKSEKDFSNSLSHCLKRHGYKVHLSFTGRSAIQDFHKVNPHIVLLGIILPDINGFKLCREFKKKAHTGIVFLTPLSEKNCMKKAFHSGADDYVTIPFDMDILLHRVNALTNRILINVQSQLDVTKIGSLYFDILKNDILHNNQYANLTPAEFRLIFYLALKKCYCTNSELLDQLYNTTHTNFESRTISVHMSKIRKKLKNIDLTKIQIKSKYKQGYLLHEA